MRKLTITSALISLLVLTGCTARSQAPEDHRLKVVTSNSIIADMVSNVAQDSVQLYSIVPIGTDPHEYEPLPKDIEATSNADVIFYNGLNLETGGSGWFTKLQNITHKVDGVNSFVVSEGVTPKYLTSAGKETQQDPHAWLDLQNGIIYVKNIAKVLSEKDPANAALYEANSTAYIAKLAALDTQAKAAFADVPQAQKILVTSEGAFKYFSSAYGLTAYYIWEINTENQGAPDQMRTIVDKVRASDVRSLFVESSVDPRSMQMLAEETGLPIYAKTFTDSLAKKGQEGDTYYDMLKYNLTVIHAGLVRGD